MKPYLQRVVIAGALALAALSSGSMAQPSPDEPPLLPGEVYIAGPKNCGVVMSQAQVDAAKGKEAVLKGFVGDGAFDTPCLDGVLHGWSKTIRFYFGRPLGYVRSNDGFDIHTTTPGATSGQVETVIFNGLGLNSTPVWPAPTEDEAIGSGVTLNRNGALDSIWARRVSCITVEFAVKGCNRDKPNTWFSLYVVEVAHTSAEPPKTRRSTTFPCPNPQNAATCEPLWRSQLAPYQPQIDDIMARAKVAEAEKIRQLDDLNGVNNPIRKAQIEAEKALRQQAREDEAARQMAERIAAAERAEQAEADAATRTAQIKADLEAAQAKADAAFRQKVAAGNPGSLYALADELAEAGDTAKAKEVLRNLISRFPNHPLTATAAQRLSTLGGAASASHSAGVASPASAPRASAPPRFSSVCVRNMQKVEDALYKANARQAAASNDRWLINLNDLGARLYQPCASYDPKAATTYKRAVDEAARIRQYCSVPRAAYECLEWGYGSAEMNRNWFNIWNGEMQKALNDPNYSADLGTAAGPGGTVIGASVQQAAAPPARTSIDNPKAHEQCRAEMLRLGSEMDRYRQRIPAGQTVPLLELIMWHSGAAARAISGTCPGSAPFASDRLSFLKTYSDAETTCNKIAVRACSEKLPD